MTILGIFLAGALVGAAIMFSSNHRASLAADRERARGEKREERLRKERDAHAAAADQYREQLTQMRIEQANSAGYEDGRAAAQQETDNQYAAGAMTDLFNQSLRDGKSVVVGIRGH